MLKICGMTFNSAFRLEMVLESTNFGRQIYTCSQNGDSVVTYYGRLRKLWEEIQGYLATPCSGPCKCGSKAQLAKERDDERTHQFLIGLDSAHYSHVQSNMLMQNPLSSLNMVFSKPLQKNEIFNLFAQMNVSQK